MQQLRQLNSIGQWLRGFITLTQGRAGVIGSKSVAFPEGWGERLVRVLVEEVINCGFADAIDSTDFTRFKLLLLNELKDRQMVDLQDFGDLLSRKDAIGHIWLS